MVDVYPKNGHKQLFNIDLREISVKCILPFPKKTAMTINVSTCKSIPKIHSVNLPMTQYIKLLETSDNN